MTSRYRWIQIDQASGLVRSSIRKKKRPQEVPSLKLTAKAPKNGWLEDDPFLLGFGLFSGAMLNFRGLVSKVYFNHLVGEVSPLLAIDPDIQPDILLEQTFHRCVDTTEDTGSTRFFFGVLLLMVQKSHSQAPFGWC